MMRLFQWVRSSSQKYLLEAAQARLARSYLHRAGPVYRRTPQVLFWKWMFVPIYQRLPWQLRRATILAMPGSHHRGWPAPTLQDHHPAQARLHGRR